MKEENRKYVKSKDSVRQEKTLQRFKANVLK
jgi:hypothetical protein